MYFDNAATTIMKPKEVYDAVSYAMSHFGNPGRGVNNSSLQASRCVYDTRAKLSDFFGANNPENIAFTPNATFALNTAIMGLIKPGYEVVTTAMEHNSVLRPLFKLAGISSNTKIEFSNNIWRGGHDKNKGDINLKIMNTDKNGVLNIEDMERAVTPSTDVVVITHGSNVTGNINDISAISKLAHKNGAKIIVDAAQTAGELNINVQKMGIDILCFSGHKSLFGPQGTGGLYVSENIKLNPLIVGGSGTQSYSVQHPTQMPTALEAGTINSHCIAGLNASISWVKDIGVDKIASHNTNLLNKFYSGIKDIPRIKVYGDFTQKNRCSICSISLEGLDPAALSDILNTKYNIETRSGAHCAPLMHQALGTQDSGLVRFSFSYFNTEEEIDAAICALKQISDTIENHK